MKTTRFAPTAELIVIRARLAGPRMEREVSLALDTAATETLVIPEIIDDLGYSESKSP